MSSPDPSSQAPNSLLDSTEDLNSLHEENVDAAPYHDESAQDKHLSQVEDKDLNLLDSIEGEAAETPDSIGSPERKAGWPTQWKRWTVTERDVWQTQEMERARDLSIHLYNTHALKRRFHDAEEGWRVPRSWAAWPLGPDKAPRPGEEPWSLHFIPSCIGAIHISNNSRADLEDELIATASKEARKRLRGRGIKAWHRRAGARRRKEKNGSYWDSTASESEGDRNEANVIEVAPPDTGPDAEDDVMAHREEHGSQSYPAGSSQEPEFKLEPSDRQSPGRDPVPSAGDDQYSRLLRPAIRSQLSAFDQVLMALHRSRQTCLLRDDVSEMSSEVESYQSENLGGKRAGSLGKPSDTSQSLGRSGGQSQGSDGGPDQGEDSSERGRSQRAHSARQSRSRSRRNMSSASIARASKARQARLGLRDWCEVVGMASITDAFPPEVVERARGRCTALFGETMNFQSFGES